MPTFMIFKKGKVVSKIIGADPRKLSDAIKKLAAEADSNGTDKAGSGSGGGFRDADGAGPKPEMWLGAELPKGYSDITDEIMLNGLDLLNVDSELGSARVLFDERQPTGRAKIGSGDGSTKGKEKASSAKTGGEDDSADWIESDTDEQVMLFMPFRSSLKVHSLHITSLPPKPSSSSSSTDSSEILMRPKTVNVYSNRAHVLGFEEAEDIPATQTITLTARDWDEKTGTAKVELRFVKFQNVTSLVLFVVDGDGGGEKVRLDRIRIVGEAGRKREMGKLEKIGDELGE